MKQIPIALQAHYDTLETTKCFLLRVLTKSGELYGFTSLDVDVVYDPSDVDPEGTGDDWGSATHRADNGFSPSRIQSTADLGVDNAEFQGWVSETGITEQQIRAGLFDYAEFRIYRVNYLDLTQGHEFVHGGTLGETKFSRVGWRTEMRSLTQQLMQPMSWLYSTTCRKIFGSKPAGYVGEQPIERHPCGKDWVWAGPYTVTAVDAGEPDRIFTASAMTEPDSHYRPGVVRWLTGNNAGIEMDIDDNVGDEVTLSINLPYEIEVGDTFEPRQDCNKHDIERNGVPGDCKDKHDNLLQFGGEPDTPIADGGTLMVPGAHIRQ